MTNKQLLFHIQYPLRHIYYTKLFLDLKDQCHEIFCFWFFSRISFPRAPECSIKTVSNFFENSRRYSQLKVCHHCQRHRWQMERIFNQKNFNNFVWSPLSSRGNLYINFCLQVHFQVSSAWYCSHYLPPVSMTPAANLPPVSLIPVAICQWRRWHRRQICRRYRWHRCQQHKGNWWQNLPPVSLVPVVHLNLQISPRIFETRAWGRWFMKKTWSKKSRDTVPLSS